MNTLSRTARLISAFAAVAITLTLLARGVRDRRAAAQRADRQDAARRPAGATTVAVALAATTGAIKTHAQVRRDLPAASGRRLQRMHRHRRPGCPAARPAARCRSARGRRGRRGSRRRSAPRRPRRRPGLRAGPRARTAAPTQT